MKRLNMYLPNTISFTFYKVEKMMYHSMYFNQNANALLDSLPFSLKKLICDSTCLRASTTTYKNIVYKVHIELSSFFS